MSLLNRKTITRENIEEFLLIFGHRAPLDYEFSEPRFNEDMNLVRQYIERSAQTSSNNDVVKSIQKDIDTAVPALPDSKVLAISVQRARNFMRLKEEAKHFCLIELAQIRRLLLTIDEKCHLDGRVFQLMINEVIQLNDPEHRGDLIKMADQRFEESLAWKSLQLPASLSVDDLERIDMLTGTRPDATELSELSGKRVAGEQEVVGRARVITDIDQIHTFKEGEILIARMTDPTWYPLFSQARGIVTEVGGWLSHAAIVAREYDLPAIVGVPGVCQRLNTGDVIRMTLAGSVEILEERRTPVTRSALPAEAIAKAVAKAETTLRNDKGDSSINVYQLTSRKIFKYQQSVERRAMKNSLGDRRAETRLTASGEIERDRRAANRAANSALLKKVG
jgi:phosphohistidine swiveling domain-containing protein